MKAELSLENTVMLLRYSFHKTGWISARKISLKQILLLGGALFCTTPVGANLRAPGVDWQAPSGALSTPVSLVVLGETLRFDCDEEQCHVKAIYRVQADRPLKLSFAFILPLKTRVNAQVADRYVVTDVTPAGHWQPDEDDIRLPGMRGNEPLPTYRATFQGQLNAGENKIEVSYRQPLGRYEARYGYFTTSRWFSFFQYELQPLKEWTLASDFALDLSVSMPRRPPEEGFWSSIFATSRSIECFMPDAKVIREDDRLVYRAIRGRDFPDHLVCQMGEHDLLSDPARVGQRYR